MVSRRNTGRKPGPMSPGFFMDFGPRTRVSGDETGIFECQPFLFASCPDVILKRGQLPSKLEMVAATRVTPARFTQSELDGQGCVIHRLAEYIGYRHLSMLAAYSHPPCHPQFAALKFHVRLCSHWSDRFHWLDGNTEAPQYGA